MSTDPKGGFYAAFPVTYDPNGVRTPSTTADGTPIIEDGMSVRQYAAIHLRVPMSGTEWLDDMIREAQRNEFAARAITALAPEEIPWASIAIPTGAPSGVKVFPSRL